ncbi:hypothetical protein BV898_04609 [Hypsibius exemplaris]|uniref:Uncharacterized protein n=1 Tax=Hypsibius exemplaris TaxID=2072580 RepID=A0A1W0X1Y8_HYPEX|nr:hypothetical protein BV898_04609 [Hypsibius exemplaris]
MSPDTETKARENRLLFSLPVYVVLRNEPGLSVRCCASLQSINAGGIMAAIIQTKISARVTGLDLTIR